MSKNFLTLLFLLVMCCFSNITLCFAKNENIVEVIASGFGTDEATAKEDAYTKAVEEVVGMYVSTEKELVNDTLKSEILTFSFGYVISSEVIKLDTDDTGVSVEMKVRVKKDLVAETIKIGHVQVIEFTKEVLDSKQSPAVRQRMARRLLTEMFKNYPSCIIKSNIEGNTNEFVSGDKKDIAMKDLIIEEDNGDIYLNFKIILSYDEKKYFEFVKMIRPLLDVLDTTNNRDLRAKAFSINAFESNTFPQSKNNDPQVFLCVNLNRTGSTSRWQEYRIGKDLVNAIPGLTKIQIEFLNKDGNVVVEEVVPATQSDVSGTIGRGLLYHCYRYDYLDRTYESPVLISPFSFTKKNRDDSYDGFKASLTQTYPVHSPIFKDELDQITSIRISAQ